MPYNKYKALSQTQVNIYLVFGQQFISKILSNLQKSLKLVCVPKDSFSFLLHFDNLNFVSLTYIHVREKPPVLLHTEISVFDFSIKPTFLGSNVRGVNLWNGKCLHHSQHIWFIFSSFPLQKFSLNSRSGFLVNDLEEEIQIWRGHNTNPLRKNITNQTTRENPW